MNKFFHFITVKLKPNLVLIIIVEFAVWYWPRQPSIGYRGSDQKVLIPGSILQLAVLRCVLGKDT